MDYGSRLRRGIAITTGAWNHSWEALTKNRECVVAIPGADLMKTVVDIGMCSGSDTDKFKKFKLTALEATTVRAPLVKECLFNIECKVEKIISSYGIVILRAKKLWGNTSRKGDLGVCPHCGDEERFA